MAARVLLGKSTNSNLGHSAGKYGLYISRTGDDITSCTADQLIFNTDNVGNTSDAIDLGQFQIIGQTDSGGNNVAKTSHSVSAGGSATIDTDDVSASGTGHLVLTKFAGGVQDETNIDQSIRGSYSGATTGTITSLGAAFTVDITIIKGFSTGALF